MSRPPTLLLLCGLLLSPALAWSQSPVAPAGRREPVLGEAERAARRAARRAEKERLYSEVMDQMRAMRSWKLTEELQLDQTAAAKVFPLLAQYDERAREVARERSEIARDVREHVRGGKPDNRKLQQLIDRLLANQSRSKTLEDERFTSLRPSLSLLQQAKLLLLLPRLEEDFRNRIRDAMEEQRRLRTLDREVEAPRPPPPLPRHKE
jgi:hypothetical protein